MRVMAIKKFSAFGGIDYFIQYITISYIIYFVIMYTCHIISIFNPVWFFFRIKAHAYVSQVFI